jgi:hypothetical protein
MAVFLSPGLYGKILNYYYFVNPNIAPTSLKVYTSSAPSEYPSPFPFSPAAIIPATISSI